MEPAHRHSALVSQHFFTSLAKVGLGLKSNMTVRGVIQASGYPMELGVYSIAPSGPHTMLKRFVAITQIIMVVGYCASRDSKHDRSRELASVPIYRAVLCPSPAIGSPIRTVAHDRPSSPLVVVAIAFAPHAQACRTVLILHSARRLPFCTQTPAITRAC